MSFTPKFLLNDQDDIDFDTASINKRLATCFERYGLSPTPEDTLKWINMMQEVNTVKTRKNLANYFQSSRQQWDSEWKGYNNK